MSEPDVHDVEQNPTVSTEQPSDDGALDVAAQQYRRFDLATHRDEALAAAREAVAKGQNIVLPTDTVYGIGANAFDAQAVRGLLAAKRRGRDMPPPILLAEAGMLPALVTSIPAGAQRMIDEYWPGALTLILPAATVNMDLGETNGTIAVRVPDNEAARELLRHTGPLAVSSANVSGEPPATDIDQAIAMLGNHVAVYLDGGQTPGPVASTIVDFATTSSGRILRDGVISFEALAGLSAGLVKDNMPDTQTPSPAGSESDPHSEQQQPGPAA